MAGKEFVFGINVVTGSSSKDVSELTREVDLFNQAIERVMDQVDQIDPGKLKELEVEAKAAKSIEGVTRALEDGSKATKKQAQAFDAAVNSLSIYSNKNEAMANSHKGLVIDIESTTVASDKLTKATNTLNSSTKNLTEAYKEEDGVLVSLWGTMTDGVSTVSSLINIFQTFWGAIERFSDPDFLTRLSQVLGIFSNLASLKGNSALADTLESVSDAVAGYADTIQNAKDLLSLDFLSMATEKLNQIKNTILNTGKAAVALTAIGVAAAEVGLDISAMDIVSKGAGKSLSLFGKKASRIVGDIKSIGAATQGNAIPGIIGLADKAFILGGALGVIGFQLRDSEDAFTRMTGSALLLAAALSGGLGLVLGQIIKSVGELITDMGVGLGKAMIEFTAMANKAEVASRAFAFTINNFSKAIGQSVGTMESWGAVINDVSKSSTFGSGAIEKAISLIVKESNVLGLSLEQNEKILKRSADVAAATGKTIEEVAGQFASGLTGNSQAVLALGINIRSSNKHIQEYSSELGKSFDQLTDMEKTQVRFKTIMADTVPLIGAAADATNTFAGSQAVLKRNIDGVKIVLGEAGVLEKNLLKVQNFFVQSVLNLDRGFLGLVGNLQDVATVGFIFLGFVTSAALKITLFTTVLQFSRKALLDNKLAQDLLTSGFGQLGDMMGFQAVKVTDLASLWTNLAFVTKQAMASIVQSVVATFGQIGSVIGPAIPQIIAVGKAFSIAALKAGLLVFVGIQLYDALQGFREILGPVGNEMLDWIEILGALAIALALVNKLIVASITVQRILTFTMSKLGAMAGVQTIAVTSLSAAYANFILISKAAVGAIARGLIPALMAGIVALKGMAVAAAAVIVPFLPLIAAVGVAVGIVSSLVAMIDDMSDSFYGFGAALSDVALPLQQFLGLSGATTEKVESLSAEVEQATGFFESLWNVLKSTVQLALLPFGLAALVVVEALLELKKALTSDEKELQELDDALNRNFDSQARLVGQINASIVGLTSFGDGMEIAAAESRILSSDIVQAGDAVEKAGHKIALTKDQIDSLTESLQGAIQKIGEIEKDIAKIGKSDVSNIRTAAQLEIEKVNKLEEQLAVNEEISDAQRDQLFRLKELINEQAELNIEGLKAEELSKIQKESQGLERSITKEKLSGVAALEKQLEFTLQDLDTRKAQLDKAGLLTKEIEAQIDKQKELAEASKMVKEASLAERGSKVKKVARVTKTPKAAKEKVSDAQRELESLLKNQIGLQKTINEFGKEGTDLIIMRKNERAKELDLLQKTLVAEGNVGTAQVINLAKAREMKLANLKIDAEADKKKKTADEEKAKAAEKAAATALQLGQTVADRLKQSDKDLASRTQSRIQMIQTETIEQYKSVTAEAAKLDAAGELTPQLARSFAQLKENNLEAAKFDIKEIKTDSIEQLRKDTEALVNEGKTDEEQKKAALDLALAAIDAKRAELKAAGLLTEEAKRLLIVQGKEVRKKGKGGDDDDKDDESIFDQIVEGFEEGTDMIAGAFDGLSGIMDSFAGIGGDGEALGLTKAMDEMPMMISKGMESFPTIMLAAVDSFVNGLSTLVDKLPEMISKILEMLPEIINKLFEAFGKLVDALPAIFAQLMDALPGIIIQILDKLPDIILKVLDALGEIISKVIEKIPEIIIALAERIGPIVEALVEGLVSNAAKIVIALIDTFILEGGAMKIGLAIAEAILIGLTVGIIRGLAKALLKVGEMIFAGIFDSGLEIKIDWGPVEALPEKIGDAVADVAEGIKAGGGDVFALVDLAQSKAARTIDKSIGQATKRAAQQFKQVMKSSEGLLLRVWEALRAAWLWIYNNIILPLIEGIQAVWDFFVEKILNPLLEGIQAVWDFFIEKILNPLLEGIQAVWDFFIEKILNPLLEGIQAVWDFFVDKILTPFTEGVQAVWDFFKEKILDKFAEGIQATWDWFKTNILDKFASGIQAVFDTLATKGQEAADKISGAITKLPEQARQAAEKLSAAINGLPGKATEFANNVISKLGSIGSTMWNSFTSAFGSMGGVIKDHATWAFDELFRNIKGAFGKMFEGVGGGGTGTIEGLMGTDVPIIRFAEGGVVPGTSPFPGDNKKNDSTVALLSPGEAVIPRSILADPEISRLVQSIMGGNVKFAFGGSLPKVSVSAPKISAPKLPSINDIKTMSTADLAKNLEANFEALKKLATGDLWDMFKDKIFEQVKSMMESIMKSAAGFEDGGIVPNTGMAMVHENEAVLPTGLVDAIMGTTNNKNQQSQNITLNATVNMVGADISGGKKAGKTIIDEMFTELRKRSANQKVMFQSGLIS